MAFKGFFYNSLPTVDGKWDRLYNADDYSSLLRFVVGNGVVPFNEGTNLRVYHHDDTISSKTYTSTSSTYSVKIASGYGWINGKGFENDTEFYGEVEVIENNGSVETATLETIPMVNSGWKRIDRVIVRRNEDPTVRNTLPYILKGERVQSGTPVGQEANFYFAGNINGDGTDLCIAEILVDNTSGTPVVTIYDKRADTNLCGFVNCYFGETYDKYCKGMNDFIQSYVEGKTGEFNRWFQTIRNDVSTVTMWKDLTKTIIIPATGKTFSVDIAEYEPAIDLLRVYTNGIFEIESAYTITDKTVTFNEPRQAGTELTFVVTKALDGKFYNNPDEQMIQGVEDRFTEIYERLANSDALFNEITYVCTGTDDNIKVSNIVRTFVNANKTDQARLRINIRGNFGATTPATAYTGDTIGEYARWFNFEDDGVSTRRVILDFSNCSPITLTNSTNTKCVVFYGRNQVVENCVLKCGNIADNGTLVVGVNGRGYVRHKNCRYSFIAGSSSILCRHGIFEDCEVTLISKTGNAIAFYTDPNGGVCKVDGGIYWTYTGTGVPTNFGARLVYLGNETSTSGGVATKDSLTILRNVMYPTYKTSGDYFVVSGVNLIQDGNVIESTTGAGGYVRCSNLITAKTSFAIDSSTDDIIENTVKLSRADWQSPFV